jgi:GNAT superfamily N-acetyltransferase
MKRLFVSPHGRGVGLGRALIAAILDKAIALGYIEMRLDTLPSLVEALALYQQFGFVQVPAYYKTPIESTIFMAKRLVPPH